MTNMAAIITAALAASFCLVAIAFLAYDKVVQNRNSKIIHAYAQSHAMLSSLFPSNVRDRLFAEQEEKDLSTRPLKQRTTVKSFLDDAKSGGTDEHQLGYEGAPIADLFPACTVLFADIAGFTAWSSVREPSQVFTLLETLYRAFDEVAKNRRVFKVETIGDCYVAVSGLPEQQPMHAVIMARFTREVSWYSFTSIGWELFINRLLLTFRSLLILSSACSA
jgi:Adenylate and Guanylate cyclase catalytic domain